MKASSPNYTKGKMLIGIVNYFKHLIIINNLSCGNMIQVLV